ncbi:hypothetical protein EUGRSUZ_K01065 [Eucalyptus grandis]|uniref:Uncharacterized protein n=2 Tax=Eucalyptus grandis TaxID=71139 RepID=A0ACC3ISM4_EUCGR|nr:hypothetical protein EUGRSUZ_K01065 [Eucalyptus grandis]
MQFVQFERMIYSCYVGNFPCSNQWHQIGEFSPTQFKRIFINKKTHISMRIERCIKDELAKFDQSASRG